MPTTTAQERASNASAARSRHARRRRFTRYLNEMEASGLDAQIQERMAELLTNAGWKITGPRRWPRL